MLTLDDARARLLEAVAPLPVERVSLPLAHGRHAAVEHRALRTQPPFAASAMDGYAIRYDDIPGPWRLIGEASAGRRFDGGVGAGETVRIFTGAPLPAGADTVLLQEEATRAGEHVTLSGQGPPKPGSHVRPAGLDFAAGAQLAAPGDRLTAARIGLLASGGHDVVAVHRQPRVALLSTGSELVATGQATKRDQIVDANRPMLMSLLSATGATVIDLGIVADDGEAIAAAITRASDCDLLVTIGGASVGDHDLVVPALEACGAALSFWKVAIKPGKPMLAGTLGQTHIIGLPGNPVSAFVCAHLFVIPLVRRMIGALTAYPSTIQARSTVALAANGPRRDHLRAVLAYDGEWRVTPEPVQDSSMLRILAGCNALLVRPENAPEAPPGASVPVIPLDSPALAP